MQPREFSFPARLSSGSSARPLYQTSRLEQSTSGQRRQAPPAKDDMTLPQYQTHVIHACSRQDLTVMIPAHTLWPRMQEEITGLREDTKKLSTSVEQLECRIENHERIIEKLKASNKVIIESQLFLLKTNAVLDLLAKLLNKRSLNEENPIHLQQLATNATEKQFIKAEIPKKYWRIIKNLLAVIPSCIESAYPSEIDFARLLISEGSDTHNYQFWKEIFPLLYGGSVEQVAGRENFGDIIAKLELSDT